MNQKERGIGTNYKAWTHRESRPEITLLWWVKRYGLTRPEWNACKKAARRVVEYRAWYLRRSERSAGAERNVWERPSPDEVLSAELGNGASPLRESQLLQVTAEIADHLGADLSCQYRAGA